MSTKALLAITAALTAGAALALPAEASTGMPVRGAVVFWLLDRNNDGAIDKPEIEALRAVIFDAVDANGDGRVTKDEFVDVIERAHERRGERWRRHGAWEERGDRRDGPRGNISERRERVINRLGVDEPEGLGKTDFVGGTPRLFKRADKDDNGNVSRSEFEQAAGPIGRLIIMD